MSVERHDTVTDAGMRVWVCEKGHVDDHHYDNAPNQWCSRCGGRCQRFVLDGLVRQFTEQYGPAEIRDSLSEAIWEHERSPETSIWFSFWDRLNEGGGRAPLPPMPSSETAGAE